MINIKDDKIKKQTIIVNAWNQLGNCYIYKKDHEEALECYLKANDHIKSFNVLVDDEVSAKINLNIGKLLAQK